MRLGTYRYSHPVAVYPRLQLDRFSMRVEVLGEKRTGAKLRYRVRFMAMHADGRAPNTVTWVAASSVKLDDEGPRPDGPVLTWTPYKD